MRISGSLQLLWLQVSGHLKSRLVVVGKALSSRMMPSLMEGTRFPSGEDAILHRIAPGQSHSGPRSTPRHGGSSITSDMLPSRDLAVQSSWRGRPPFPLSTYGACRIMGTSTDMACTSTMTLFISCRRTVLFPDDPDITD
jgi:hypothetical protein